MDWSFMTGYLSWDAFGIVMFMFLFFSRVMKVLIDVRKAVEATHTILADMSERWNKQVRASEDLAERKLRPYDEDIE